MTFISTIKDIASDTLFSFNSEALIKDWFKNSSQSLPRHIISPFVFRYSSNFPPKFILSETVGEWIQILVPPSYGSAYIAGNDGDLVFSQLLNINEGWDV